MPYSKGRVAQCDLLVLRRFDDHSLYDYQVQAVLVLAAIGYFDSSIQLLRDNPAIEETWRQRHGFSLEKSLEIESHKAGVVESRSYLASQLREFIPAVRSALFGIPGSTPSIPY